MVRMIGIPRIFATAASDALPRESCILIKPRFVLLHRRKKARCDWTLVSFAMSRL
jgi:hypothetical protein